MFCYVNAISMTVIITLRMWSEKQGNHLLEMFIIV